MICFFKKLKIIKLKSYIYETYFIIRLKAFNKKQFYVAILYFEGLGVSVLIPLLNFIQVEGDLTKFQNSSLISLYVIKFLPSWV